MTYVTELLDQSRPGQAVGFGADGGDVLVKAGERRVKAAREPERTHCEEPFRVVHVAKHLADAPLVRGVAVERSFLGNASKETDRIVQLRDHRAEAIVTLDLVDVGE